GVRAAAETSQLLRAVACIRADSGRRFALADAVPVPLNFEQIAQLQAAGNTAEDWQRVLVVEGFDPARVRGCTFAGDVVLGRFDGWVSVAEGVRLPAGLANATLADCVIGHGALIRNVALLAACVVGPGA